MQKIAKSGADANVIKAIDEQSKSRSDSTYLRL